MEQTRSKNSAEHEILGRTARLLDADRQGASIHQPRSQKEELVGNVATKYDRKIFLQSFNTEYSL